MVGWAAGAAIAAPIIGGIMGNMSASDDREAAMDALREGWAKLDAIGMPPDLSQRLLLEQFQQVGILTPELEQDVNLAQSQVALIKEDEGLRDAQMDALRGIQERGKIGLSAQDRAALNQIRRDSGTETEAKRQQILQNFAARGQGGSGNELIASLQANQAGAEEASMQGDRIGAMASQNALQALSQAGQLGGSIRQQDFGVAQAKAGAEDQFSLADFNAANQRQSRNVGYRNDAQASNLGAAQRTSDMNIAQDNTETRRASDAKRDYWNDRLNLASAYGGQGRQVAGGLNQQADRDANMWAGIGSGLGTGIAGFNQQSNQNTQADIGRQHDKDLYNIKYGKKG